MGVFAHTLITQYGSTRPIPASTGNVLRAAGNNLMHCPFCSVRVEAISRMQEKMARLPTLLILPSIACILPGIMVIIGGPAYVVGITGGNAVGARVGNWGMPRQVGFEVTRRFGAI